MIKKLLLTSVALLSLADVAYGYVKNPSIETVLYDTVRSTNISDGTIAKSLIVTKDPLSDEGVLAWRIEDVYVHTDFQGLLITTPKQYTGSDITFSTWTKEIKDNTKKVFQNIGTDEFLDYDTFEIMTDDDSQEAYNAYETTILNYIPYYETGNKLKGYSGIKKGSELITNGIEETSDEDPLPIVEDLYYICKWKGTKFSDIYTILGVDCLVTTGDTYTNCEDSYRINTIPANFIRNNATSLTIPYSVTKIATGAFKNAEKLTIINCASDYFFVLDEGGARYLFELGKDNKYTLIFATPNKKARTLELDDEYVAIKDGALAFSENLTIISDVIPTMKDDKGNQVIRKQSGGAATWVEENPESEQGTVRGWKVTGDIYTADLKSILTATYGKAQYVDFTSAIIGEDLDIEATVKTINKSYSTYSYNTIYFFATDKEITGNNVVNNGICSDFKLIEDGLTFFSPSQFTANKASFNRTIGTNWSTICLPFNIDNSNDTFYKTFKFGDLDSYEASGNIFNFAIHDYIVANTPNIIKLRDDSSTKNMKDFTFLKVTVNATGSEELSMTKNGASFVGSMWNHELEIDDDSDDYYYLFKNNAISRSDGGKVKTFRAYLTAPKANWSASAGAIRIVDFEGTELEYIEFEEESTDINSINMNDVEETIYNINGERINKINNSGIYIINGKKMLVK